MAKKTKPYRRPVSKETANVLAEKVDTLRELFPAAFAEGKIDWDKLRGLLDEAVDDRPERYSFTWAGKREAIRLLQTSSRATLVPAEKESVNFDTTQHLFIEGDNLEVLKLLYKPYFGRVKMVYIDPPYNTGHDFIYPDNFADPLDSYLKLTGQKTAEGNLLTSNPETSGRYHSAWLTMVYPRLFLARQLLREDGVIFVSIDDHEVHNLRLMMNEVFGEENFIATIIIQSNKRGQTYKEVAQTHEYLLVFARSSETELNELPKIGEKDDLDLTDALGRYNVRELRNRNPKFGRFNRPNLYYPIHVNPALKDDDGFFPVSIEKTKAYRIEVVPLNSEDGESCWRWGEDLVREHCDADTQRSNVVARRKANGSYGIYEKYRKTSYRAKTIWDETEVISEQGTMELGRLGLADAFDFPKPVALIKKACILSCAEDDLIVDLMAGSGTTAQAVLELNREFGGNRRFIMVQLPEPTDRKDFPTIADIGKERIRRVIKKLTKARSGELALKTRETPEDLGFKVFKLAESNYRPWSGTELKAAGGYAKEMELYTDPLLDGWKPGNVIYEVALKEGYGLNCSIEKVKAVKDCVVHRVTDPEKEQAFHICLDDKIRLKALRPLELKRDDLFICRDRALDDEAAANLALQCRLKTI